ncbi:MAG TPA: alpha/beta hydrolase-fold protein [Solirubrobacteraceae bacterium]|jgi:enterochelin esterase-like enzyme
MSRLRPRRTLLLALAFVLAGIGLVGAYRYWESYYEHRGFATLAYLPHAQRGRRVDVEFYSPALHREADYLVYLPPGYDAAQHRYPVYYLLHGSPGRPVVYYDVADMDIRLDNLISLHRMRPMILVFPDGRISDSTMSDSEWANTQAGNFASYVMNVVTDVDHRFATVDLRRDRVIAGFSAGAYGATNIALHNLATFGNLQSWSGYYLQTRSGVFSRASRAELAANSPLDYVRHLGRQLAANPLRAFLFVGRDDNSSPQQAPMAKALAARGATVSYALYRGGHDWQLWHSHLNQMLELASRGVGQPLRAGRGRARSLTPGVVPIPNGTGRQRHGRRRLIRRARNPRNRHARHTARAGRRAPATHRARRHVLVAYAAGRIGPGGRPPVTDRLGAGELIAGLVLALSSAALINLGFLLQHRELGRRRMQGLPSALRGAFRSRTWLAGQAIGWTGFMTQIVSVAIAPLALVQAFAAGGLALSVPLAAGLFRYRITRRQLLAVLTMASGLAVLPVGFSSAADRLDAGALTVCVAVALAGATMLAALGVQWLRAVAAGIFYGVADAAIKAVSIGWRAHGITALGSGWTALAGLATFAGFLAFQAALQSAGAISSISLMNALAALVALACGLTAFGESLGTSPAAVAVHIVAIGVVLGCTPVLAAAQDRMAEAPEGSEPNAHLPAATT